MNSDLLCEAIRNKRNDNFNLNGFGIEGITIEDCEVKKEIDGEKVHYKISPKMNRRKKKYIYQCQMCNRFFLGGRDNTGEYIGNCYKKFDDDRKYFFDSELDIAEYGDTLPKISVDKLLKQYEQHKTKKTGGVWALWLENRCIQVAKSIDIYYEIYLDFKAKGSINYEEYRSDGEIVIVSTDGSDLAVEVQYAHDHKAEKWNPGFSEPKQIGILKGMRKID